MTKTNWKEMERILSETLGLVRPPIAITFCEREPEGVEKFSGTEPSGCSFWRLAAEGRRFYTTSVDHLNCAVGTFTHSIDPPEKRKDELTQTLGLMFSVNYIREEELAGIPRLGKEPKAIVYAPLGDTPLDPSVVIMTCRPSKAMLLNEALIRSKVKSNAQVLGRPTCMALPAALENGTTLSLGCIGNRVYTGAGEDEMYIVIPGANVEKIAQEMAVIAKANQALEEYASGRKVRLTSI
jgi:uncharacterized protein (DUF169 family)